MTDLLCYHCQLPIKEPPLFFADIEGEKQPMCCPGCKAVAEAIIAGGLQNYYHHRTEAGVQADTVNEQLQAELLIYDREDIQKEFVQVLPDSNRQANLLIEGITCAACIWLLEKHLTSISGVKAAYINLSTHEAQIEWDPETTRPSCFMRAIYTIGYKAFPWRADRQEALLQQENRRFIRRLAVAGIGAMQVMMYAIALYSGAISNDMTVLYRDFIRYISAIVATPVVFYAAMPFFKSAIRDIKLKHPGMDVPVSIAIGGAYLASLWATYTGAGEVYFDSVCMFTFFLLTGRYLELKARHATSRAARVLSNLLPASCLKVVDGSVHRVPLNDIQEGDWIRALPGSSIPSDGIIISGSSSIDESMLTGEYMPISKMTGDHVLAGSTNIDNAIDVKVTHTGNETRVAGIVELLRRAKQEKPPIALMADRVAGWFVTAVLLIAVVVYSYWSQHSPEDAFWITLSVLVVTCPCALSLATPAALTAATGYLHRAGLLITRGHVLEGIGQINHIIFDKTGTLTNGKLTLADVKVFKQCTSNKSDLINLAAALEAHSEHPIAKAFNRAGNPKQASRIINHTGQGIEGIIDGKCYRIGKAGFAVSDTKKHLPPDSGQWLMLSCENSPLCWFRITDSLRQEAEATIRQLKQSGQKITLLSGDQESTVSSIALSLGIDNWQSESNPDDKLAYVKHCQQQGDKILMIGDGINDIPVLAGADISLAMGNASDLARTSADAVLINLDLTRITDLFRLTQRTRMIIRQNLTWALGYNVIALPMASVGLIAPWMAATGMALSSLIVVGNALRLNVTKAGNNIKQKSTGIKLQEA